MKFKVLNDEPVQFYNASGDLMGTISVSGSGDMIIRPESGSNRNIIIGDPETAGDIEIGLPTAPVNFSMLGGGTITSKGNTLNIGSGTNNDTVNLYNVTYSQSLYITGSVSVTGSMIADNFIGGAADLSGSLTVLGTQRSLFTSCSMVYSGSNVTQVTKSFSPTSTQITNILYSGSFADGNIASIALTGSDGVKNLYTYSYSDGLVTEILVT